MCIIIISFLCLLHVHLFLLHTTVLVHTTFFFLLHLLLVHVGPLNLGCLYRYCEIVNNILNSKEHKGKQIYHYASPHGMGTVLYSIV